MDAPSRRLDPLPPSPPIAGLTLPEGCDSWGTDLVRAAEIEKKLTEAPSGTPSAVAAALSPAVMIVGGRELHKFSIQTYLNLQKLGSPFVDRQAGEEVDPSIQEVITALWAMIEPDVAVRRLVALGGDKLDDAIATFASSVSMDELGASAERITGKVAAGFAPGARMNPPQQEGGDTPLSAAATASAGASP